MEDEGETVVEVVIGAGEITSAVQFVGRRPSYLTCARDGHHDREGVVRFPYGIGRAVNSIDTLGSALIRCFEVFMPQRVNFCR